MQTWKYPSSSGGDPYDTLLGDDGLLSCNCRGYLIKRPNKPRSCRHVDDVIKKHGLNIVQRGDLLFATNGPSPTLLPQEDVDHVASLSEAEKRGYVNPMLASAMLDGDTIAKYQDGNHVAEIKYDGQRVILAVSAARSYFWSRPRPGEGTLGLPKQLGQHIELAVARLLPPATYDGEVITGLTGKSYDAGRHADRDKQILVLFDILKFGAADIMSLPYTERRKLLEIAVPFEGQCIQLAQAVAPTQEEVDKLWAVGAEGVILKRKTSIYRPGWRSPDWRKIKRVFAAAGIVTGFEKGENGPYSKLLVTSDEGVGTSVKAKNNAMLREAQANPQAFIGRRLVISHYGLTPKNKYRGPIIFDHWAGEGE